MTDNAPRRIEGLQPRATAPLARLLKSERDAAPAQPAAEPADAEATPSETGRQPPRRSPEVASFAATPVASLR